MAKSKRLPKQVFIVWTEGAIGEWFFETTTKIEDVKYAGVEIGVYKLTKTRKFKLIEEKMGQAKK